MSREFSVRVNPELAGWVRCAGESPTRVLAGILHAIQQRRFQVNSRDPGVGSERLTVRVPERALAYVREAGHSRETLVAIRKLYSAAFEFTRALPASRVSVLSQPPARSVPRAPSLLPSRAASSLTLLTSGGRSIPFGPDGRPVLGDASLALANTIGHGGYGLAAGNASEAPLGALDAPSFRLPASLDAFIQAVPVPVVILGSLALIAGIGWFLSKGLGSLFAGGAATGAKLAVGAATAAKAAPAVVPWIPKAISVLAKAVWP